MYMIYAYPLYVKVEYNTQGKKHPFPANAGNAPEMIHTAALRSTLLFITAIAS